MAEVYGGDPNVMEYAFSLLTFVEPMGPWARRWAARQLDLATDGLHSQCAQAAKYPYLKDENSTIPSFNWMHTARLTVSMCVCLNITEKRLTPVTLHLVCI